MKPFILILLVALSVEAQSVADAARKERARRSELPTVRVLTNEDALAARTLAGDPEEPKATTPQSADAKADAAKTTDKPAPQTTKTTDTKTPPADPTQAFNAEVQKVRAHIRELQDRETALVLQESEFRNQFYAPVTSQGARSEAQNSLAATQAKLTDVRKELEETRTKLRQMEAQGPPKK